MIAEIEHRGRRFRVDLSKPLDLSLPTGPGGPSAAHAGDAAIEPVSRDGRPQAVREGAAMNLFRIALVPQGHGTYTAGAGQLDPQARAVGGLLKRFFFTAQVVSLRPETRRAPDGQEDRVITLEQLRHAVDERPPEALVLRTMPPDEGAASHRWSGTNPCYLQSTACAWLRSIGVKHLLLDLPGPDREEDGGVLAAQRAFWDHPASLDLERTVTGLAHVPAEVRDGDYLLELQLPHLVAPAAPSRPVLYALLP